MKAISTTKMRVFTDEEINEVNGMQVVTNKEVNEISGGVCPPWLPFNLPWAPLPRIRIADLLASILKHPY